MEQQQQKPLVGPLGDGQVWGVQSETYPAKVYMVAIISTGPNEGRIFCSCPAVIEDCKHIRYVKAAIVVAATQTP